MNGMYKPWSDLSASIDEEQEAESIRLEVEPDNFVRGTRYRLKVLVHLAASSTFLPTAFFEKQTNMKVLQQQSCGTLQTLGTILIHDLQEQNTLGACRHLPPGCYPAAAKLPWCTVDAAVRRPCSSRRLRLGRPARSSHPPCGSPSAGWLPMALPSRSAHFLERPLLLCSLSLRSSRSLFIAVPVHTSI